ncbi:MAG: cell division protein FtsZ [Segetibacter sp.]|jgi:cell division protein FtsZ
MIHFDLPKQKSSILKVIGIGGGGGNAVNHMYGQNIDTVDFIICNTDAQALSNSKVPNKIQLGPHLTQGLGAGANPDIGKQACEESLEEIKKILEVNTKMAFITAGMGGGTGTGGAPIIAKICKDLGVLTVGIVTTPFTNEGPKRMRHAEAGIQALRESVDTLLVISNDKVRHQYGNLKVREAFSKADDILATAAKCITDVITSNGQINVDFADVCTVMRNGGVAILGNAIADGEDRAQRAIEDAVNSPLLNDSEIRGAKWILINITSAEGDNEITMDEEDTIMSYLREQAGDDADVIKGIGFDESLGNKIGVTIIATGFEHKDPFKPTPRPKQEKKPEDKVVMKLEMEGEEKKLQAKPPEAVENKDPFAPTLVEMPATAPSVIKPMERQQQDKEVVRLELKPENIEPVNSTPAPAETSESVNNNSSNTGTSEVPPMRTGSGFLSKPANIYADSNLVSQSSNPAETKSSQPVVPEQQEFEMKLVMKDEVPPAADEPRFPFAASTSPVEIPATPEDADEQKRRAQERIQKLRNLSFNINSADASSEFDSVPAYVRKNMEQSGNASIESFYSKYTVKSDENDKGQISSINTFLDGKKPD